MGACREGYDLFHKYGRMHFRKNGWKWAKQYVLQDTLGHHICPIIGHSKKTFQNDENEKICMRCFRVIRRSNGTP